LDGTSILNTARAGLTVEGICGARTASPPVLATSYGPGQLDLGPAPCPTSLRTTGRGPTTSKSTPPNALIRRSGGPRAFRSGDVRKQLFACTRLQSGDVSKHLFPLTGVKGPYDASSSSASLCMQAALKHPLHRVCFRPLCVNKKAGLRCPCGRVTAILGIHK
jgi:hypothetical protein